MKTSSITILEADINECMNGLGNYGICLECGVMVFEGCEPDARKYPCEECGKNSVYGLEEAILMGVGVVPN